MNKQSTIMKSEIVENIPADTECNTLRIVTSEDVKNLVEIIVQLKKSKSKYKGEKNKK